MNESTITVRGESEITEEPNATTVHVGVEIEGDERQEVFEEFNRRSNEVRERLEQEFNPDDKQLVSSTYDFGKRKVHTGSRKEEDKFYGNHVFEVTTTETDEVNSIINVSLDAGATDIRNVVYGLSESVQNDCVDSAIEQAVQNASRKASVATDAEDRELGNVLSIEVNDSNTPQRTVNQTLESVADTAMNAEVQEDDVSVNVAVKVTYEIN